MNDLAVLDIRKKIHTFRGRQVMLDSDLTDLYKVPVKVLNQAVKRNQNRFPERFMFQINQKELEILRSQTVTSRGEFLRFQNRTLEIGRECVCVRTFTSFTVRLCDTLLRTVSCSRLY